MLDCHLGTSKVPLVVVAVTPCLAIALTMAKTSHL